MDLITKLNDAVSGSIFVGETMYLHYTANSETERFIFTIIPQYNNYLIKDVTIQSIHDDSILVDKTRIFHNIAYDGIIGFCYGYTDGYQLKK